MTDQSAAGSDRSTPSEVASDGLLAAPGSRRRLILAMAAFTTLVEAGSVADLLPGVAIGPLTLSLSVLPAMGLAVACGDRLLGRSSLRRLAAWYWILAASMLLVLAAIFVGSGRGSLYVAFVVAAFQEELVYRLAIPAVLALALQAVGVRSGRARLASLALAGVWFVLLPGHQQQMSGAAGALPFLAFATLAAVLVHRSGSVLPMALAHAVVNLVTVLMWNDEVPADARNMTILCVLTLLVLAYGKPRRLTLGDDGGMLDTVTGLDVTTIDLHGPQAQARLSDGTVVVAPPTMATPVGIVVPGR